MESEWKARSISLNSTTIAKKKSGGNKNGSQTSKLAPGFKNIHYSPRWKYITAKTTNCSLQNNIFDKLSTYFYKSESQLIWLKAPEVYTMDVCHTYHI